MEEIKDEEVSYRIPNCRLTITLNKDRYVGFENGLDKYTVTINNQDRVVFSRDVEFRVESPLEAVAMLTDLSQIDKFNLQYR